MRSEFRARHPLLWAAGSDGPGAGYGDLAYLIPQMGGGNAVDALVGDESLSIGYWASAAETRNMARHIIALMK